MTATSARSASIQATAKVPYIQEIHDLVQKAVLAGEFITEPYKVSGPEFNRAYYYFTKLGYHVRTSGTPVVIQPHEGTLQEEYVESIELVLGILSTQHFAAMTHTATATTAQQLDDTELAEALQSAEEWLTHIAEKIRARKLPPNSQSLEWAEGDYEALIAEWIRRYIP